MSEYPFIIRIRVIDHILGQVASIFLFNPPISFYFLTTNNCAIDTQNKQFEYIQLQSVQVSAIKHTDTANVSFIYFSFDMFDLFKMQDIVLKLASLSFNFHCCVLRQHVPVWSNWILKVKYGLYGPVFQFCRFI